MEERPSKKPRTISYSLEECSFFLNEGTWKLISNDIREKRASTLSTLKVVPPTSTPSYILELFITPEVWGKLAEEVNKNLAKGISSENTL